MNCRLKNMEKFSPKRIILDNKLQLNSNSYLFKTAKKDNTIIFYNEAENFKILEFKLLVFIPNNRPAPLTSTISSYLF